MIQTGCARELCLGDKKDKERRKVQKFWFLCLILNLFLFVGCASTIEADAIKPVGLKIYTEAYPPLNFAEKGKVTGLATEVVRELMKRTGTGADIQLVTWEEGYKAVMEKPNVALFSVAMTAQRKSLLQWVGPIAILNANLYARKGSKFEIRHLAWRTQKNFRRSS